MGFSGTISLGLDGLTLVLTRITDALYRYGIRKFIILNGHGGNIKTIESVGLNLHKKGALPTIGFNNVAFKGGTISIPREVPNYSSNGWIGPDAPHPGHPCMRPGNARHHGRLHH